MILLRFIPLQTDVALLSITATGTGLNLTRANVALFAELVWSSGTLAQGEDRLHRLGQKSAVRIIYVLAEGSADDIVWAKLNQKQSVIGATVGSADAAVRIPEKSSKSGNGTRRKTPEPSSSSSSSSQVSMDTFLRARNASSTACKENEVAQGSVPTEPPPAIVSDPKLIYGAVTASSESSTAPAPANACPSINPASLPSKRAVPKATEPEAQPPRMTSSNQARPLSPSTLQRIEANRLKALAKKEAARQRALQQSSGNAVRPVAASHNFATAAGSSLRVESQAVADAAHRLQLDEGPVTSLQARQHQPSASGVDVQNSNLQVSRKMPKSID